MVITPCLRLTCLIFTMISVVLLMVMSVVPLFHWHESYSSGVAATPAPTLVGGALIPNLNARYKIWIGLYDTTLFYRSLGRKDVETNDYWKEEFVACSDGEMVSSTKALQAFWVASVISSLVLLALFTTHWCCKPVKAVYLLALQLVVFICVIVTSACVGYLYSHNFCPTVAGYNVLKDLDGMGFELSTGSFFLFTVEVLMFITSIITCGLTCCSSFFDSEDPEPEDREMDVHAYPQANSYANNSQHYSQGQYSHSQQYSHPQSSFNAPRYQ
eukprot:TRINITY_DN8542_c0_g1_i1.p1 TRINITY_DN8542_c0_g1~~TRINITY_DN8542_c0_g1_i1.p1  ORF type:complete len:290 (+),score=31.03 TRINITY_DN8542_c0_g1_i1:57-872(+)